MTEVAVYIVDRKRRAKHLGLAMAAGARRHGCEVRLRSAYVPSRVEADIAVFYGFIPELREKFRVYRGAGKPVVYLDLGYWGREEGGRLDGYHKVSVNDRHPNAYFQNRRHDESRASRFGHVLKDWRGGDHILLAGMSAKSAGVEGLESEEWERAAVAALRRHTDRRIIYRPKPKFRDATQIDGTEYGNPYQSLRPVLDACHAVVSHHSNVNVDGLIEGIPSFCSAGAAMPMSVSDLALIESPSYPQNRWQWLCDLAFCQWTPAEMESGATWAHLRDEGLVPG